MAHLQLALSGLIPVFLLFAMVLVLFMIQEILLRFVAKKIQNERFPKFVNWTVYISFTGLLFWYANTYLFQQGIVPFVRFFVR